MTNTPTRTTMPQDFKKDIDWIMAAYELAHVTFSDGFQKDAIQNACGARPKDSWKDWRCKIYLVNNEKGEFLIIEDEGTAGLTGPNISAQEISNKIDNDEDIPSEWRLARFSSRNVSGGIQTGAGKYGVGKSVYSACSTTYDYYFDSLRNDGIYVANENRAGTIFEKAYENDEAKKFISDNVGISAKTTVGTRVIICNPKPEIVESINSGDMKRYIQESWWRCIEKMPDDCGIFIGDERVNSPEFSEFEHQYEMTKSELYTEGYRVRKFGFFIDKKGSETGWHGVSYYRRGMKIGTVDLSDMPATIRDRFWGYIELDRDWEDLLADIEDAVHYGVRTGKKHTTTYQNMRLYVSQKVNELLISWRYRTDKEYEDKKLQEALKEISSELNSLFDEMGFEDLGKGPKKPDFTVRWRSVQYPHDDSLTVLNGDRISFGFRISNEYLTDKKFNFKVEVYSKKDNRRVCLIDDSTCKLDSGSFYDKDYEFEVTTANADRYEENRIVLTVKVIGSTKEKRKELPFFFDLEKPDNSRREVILSIHSVEMPREDSMRVDFGETIKNLTYSVENKRRSPLQFALNVSLHNCEDPSTPKIMDIARISGSATPFEDVIVTGIPDIVFDEDKIAPFVDKGVLEIRARLIATADSDEFERGDKITHFYQKIYLNKDEKSGKEDSFEPRTQDAPDNYRRSWCVPGNKQIVINSAHPAYKASQADDEDWKSYLKQEMLKQYVLLYLEEGKYGAFGEGRDITQMDPIDASRCIMDRVEEVYRRSFK